MSLMLSRRGFLAFSTAFAAAGLTGRIPAAAAERRLVAGRRTIEVNGRSASVFGLTGSDGRPGLVLAPGERFAVALNNQAGEPTIIHWHGQTPPPDQDGVTDTGYAAAIAPGATEAYDFTPRAGTHWMHSHHGLQEQLLMAAPLIVRNAADMAADRQEVTVLFHDFTFRDPAEILQSLGGGMNHGGMNHGGMGTMGGDMPMDGTDMSGTDMGGMDMGGMDMGGMDMGAMSGEMGMDLNDVDYDAYLANDRTLDDPEVVRTEANGKVLLRLINGATSTAFWVDLGGAEATVVAVDGNAVRPVTGSRFPMAQGQRLDLEVTVPAGRTVGVLAQREGDRARTGIILAAPGAAVAKIAAEAQAEAPPADLSLELRLAALEPLADRKADVVHPVMLMGSMMPYSWSIDGRTWADHKPLEVQSGQRVIIDMMNHSMMAHPMHLHGHHFQVIGLNGQRLSGAVRDTVLVPPMGRVAVAFDAGNAGRWLFHCHNLFHMATGMMTEVAYRDAA